jgi:SAM-dependent methyltransferase
MSSNRALPDRSGLFAKLSEDEIVARYRRVWGPKVGLDEVKAQALLEGELTDRLLLSTPDNRWSEFSAAYGRLFSELPWRQSAGDGQDLRDFQCWSALVGRNKTLLEIGSGGGQLIRSLAARGHSCFASEVTPERGEKFVPPEDGVTWVRMDGVHLTRFVDESAFDVILSDQVFEHLHPDDQLDHMREARKALRDGGRYILRAPHRAAGPRDLSEVFGLDEAVFLHLCEPDYGMMRDLCRRAGFRRTSAVLAVRRFGLVLKSSLLLDYQTLIERVERRFAATPEKRRAMRKWGRYVLAHDYVWIVAEK